MTYRIHRGDTAPLLHTRYTHPRGLRPPPPSFPFRLSHTRARRAYTWNSKCLSLSGAEGAWPSATYRALPFQPVVWRRDAAILEEEKKTPALIQYARDTSEIFGVLCWLWCVAPIHPDPFARVYARRKREREGWGLRQPPSRSNVISDTTIPSPPLQPSSAVLRGRAPFRNLPMAKECPRGVCARLASNPRFLSFNWKLAERRCYRTTLLLCTNVVCSYCELLRTVYVSGSLGIYLRRNFLLS